jgi:hypothetical protein
MISFIIKAAKSSLDNTGKKVRYMVQAHNEILIEELRKQPS